MIFVGFFVGGIVVGPFSDKFGRKITMYISGFLLSVVSLLAAFPEAFWLFALFRCLIGFGIGKLIDLNKSKKESLLTAKAVGEYIFCCIYAQIFQGVRWNTNGDTDFEDFLLIIAE